MQSQTLGLLPSTPADVILTDLEQLYATRLIHPLALA